MATARLALVALLGVAWGDLSIRSESAATKPLALWASISENKSEVRPIYASMAGDHPASGKNWSSKPKEQVNAWNRTMQHTYHKYIPSSYQKLPSKAADIRASSAASKDEQKFTGYSDQYGGLAKVAMRGAKRDFHQRSQPSDGKGATPDMPDLHEYADRYASQESSDDAAYESYLKDYAGSSKGQDGEKYMAGSGGSSIPNYQHFEDYASNDKSRAATSHDHSQGPSEPMSYQKYAAGGGSSSWDKQYGHSAGWKHQLSGVVPSFVPRFVGLSSKAEGLPAPANGVDASSQLSSAQDGLQHWCWLAAAPLAGFTLAAGVQFRSRRTVHPPESLLG